MADYYGDFPASAVVYMVFDSFAASTGAPSAVTNFAAGDIQIYKDGGTTQRSSSAGITVSTSFDTQTGLQMVAIDTSDNTDAGFYAAGHEYSVAVADITVDGQTLRFWLGAFSIERTNGALARAKDIQSRIPAALTGGGNIKADAIALGGTSQTGRDIGASVLLSAGSGTGQLDFTSGVVKSNLSQILGTALTETAGQIAGGFKKFFNIATPASTMDALTLVATATDVTTKTGYRLSSTGVDDILRTALTESYAADGAAGTLSQILFGLQAFLQERSVSGTTLTVKKLDGSTTAMTFTLNDGTTPTSLTRAS